MSKCKESAHNGSTKGPYRVIRKLGEGGMGQVYLAEDTRDGKRVALKFLPPGFCADADSRARFLQEAEILATMNHPNIVCFLEVRQDNGCLYLVLEYVDGESLADLVKQDPLPLDRTVTLAREIARGLAAAHRQGVVHRDIKPGNVLVDTRGRARILDFGLACSRNGTNRRSSGSTIGTPHYESPEQLLGRSTDARSDLFSLGIVIYQMLTGHLPFASDYAEGIPYAILHDDPTPMATYRDDIPAELERVVMRLLEKDPARRFQDARRLAAALTRVRVALGRVNPLPRNPGSNQLTATRR